MDLASKSGRTKESAPAPGADWRSYLKLLDIRSLWYGRSVRTQLLVAVGAINLLAALIAGGIAIFNTRMATQVEIEASLEVATKPPPGMPHPSDLLSGGTMQSMAVVTRDEDATTITDPAALIDDPSDVELVRARSPIEVAPRRGDGGAVIAPMSPAAFINPAVIQRTAALRARQLGQAFQPFRYREGVAIRGPAVTLPLRYAAAGMMSGMQAGMAAAAKARPGIRKRVGDAMSSVMPGSGFGPVGDRVEGWRWSMRLDALTTTGKGIRVDLEADGQPGYLTTARMLGEAGLMLADEGVTPDVSGCVTPAIALGTGAIDRFERARMRFSVGS